MFAWLEVKIKYTLQYQLNENLDTNASTLAYLNHLVETVVCHK